MGTGNETPWAVSLRGRDRGEEHRSATPLELFFDLSFVVAVAAAADNLHHGVADAHWGNLAGYLAVFFAIWWAWMNYTWFASAYDTNDVLFRVLTFVQMAGVLVLATGVPRAFNEGDFGVVVLGYAVMRLPLMVQWLRAARGHPQRRATALTYAVGIALLQLLWLLRAVTGGWGGIAVFVVLAAGELLVPVLAERRGATPWHPGHIVERYGLMTIIVLGEVLLSTTDAISGAVGQHGVTSALGTTVVGGLLIVFSLWWFYFKHSYEERLAEEQRESPFVWGYAHYLVFASVAAVGAGLGACIDVAENVARVGSRSAAFALAIPLAIYLVTLGALHALDGNERRALVRSVVTSVLVLGIAAAEWEIGRTVLAMGLVLLGALAEFLVVDRDPRAQRANARRAERGQSIENIHG